MPWDGDGSFRLRLSFQHFPTRNYVSLSNCTKIQWCVLNFPAFVLPVSIRKANIFYFVVRAERNPYLERPH